MAQTQHWYVKEISELTHISVQTLHHYDKIGLLNPSHRLPNGYRLYTEADLSKLQQIIALKFFGFDLAKIKELLQQPLDMLRHFFLQVQCLDEKAKHLMHARDALKNILSQCSDDQSIPWQSIIKIIEVYRMTETIDHQWAREILTEEELKKFVAFQQELKNRFSNEEKIQFESEWQAITKEIYQHMNESPESTKAIGIAKRMMDRVNKLYGHKNGALRFAIWEKGFKGGHGKEFGLSEEAVVWLDQAVYAYHTTRIKAALNAIGLENEMQLKSLWELLLRDMYGDWEEGKKSFIQDLLNDTRINQDKKNWIKKIFEP